jgi:hypothetical protein
VARARRVLTGGFATLLTFAFASLAIAALPQPGRFDGTTSQTYPDGNKGTVTIKMTRGGVRIKAFDITWLARCDSGFSELSQGTHAEGTVSSRGRFHGSGRYFSDAGNLEGTGFTAMIEDRLGGRFVSKTKAKGTFQATAVLRDSAGRPVSTCSTPTIGWTAKHR